VISFVEGTGVLCFPFLLFMNGMELIESECAMGLDE